MAEAMERDIVCVRLGATCHYKRHPGTRQNGDASGDDASSICEFFQKFVEDPLTDEEIDSLCQWLEEYKTIGTTSYNYAAIAGFVGERVQATPNRRPRRLVVGRKIWMVVAVVVIAVAVIAVAVALGITLPPKGGTSKTQPTPLPMPGPTTANTQMSAGFVELINSISLSERTLQYPSSDTSAEQIALNWLIENNADEQHNSERIRQRYGLLVLYFSTNGPNWRPDPDVEGSDWTTTGNECDWKRVDCNSDGVVTTLRPSVFDMDGTLPHDIGQLSSVTRLSMRDNSLTGTIPSGMGKMTSLKWLDLVRTSIRGTIPQSFSNLKELDIFEANVNSLSGSIPPQIDLWWPKMRSFAFLDNQLTGSLPVGLGNLSRLEAFNVEANKLSGSIPTAVGNLQTLKHFNIGSNAITGTVPSEMSNLNNLEGVSLFATMVSGTIPFCGMLSLEFLAADCQEVDCPCCTFCCPTSFNGIPRWNGSPECN